MTTPVGRRGPPHPALEGAGEGAGVRIIQDLSDLPERQVRLGDQLAGDLAADLVGHLSERAAFGFQVPGHGPVGYGVEAGYHGGRTGIPDELDAEHAPQLVSQRLSAMARSGQAYLMKG